jgi:hypothetical protein
VCLSTALSRHPERSEGSIRDFQGHVASTFGTRSVGALQDDNRSCQYCWVALLLALFSLAASAATPHFLIDNFSSPLPDAGNAGLSFAVDSKDPKIGLGHLVAAYSFPAEQRQADFELPRTRWPLPAPGKLTFWFKGDGSANELALVVYAGQPKTEPDGRRTIQNIRGTDLPKLKLDSTDWKEVTLDVPVAADAPADTIRWIGRLRLSGTLPNDKKAPQPKRFDGNFALDDLRLFPATAQSAPTAAASAILLGPLVRDFTSEFAVALDARNFTNAPAKVKVRLSMTDRNQNPVVSRDFDLEIAANQSKEFKLDLAPENVGLFLPPFRVSGDVMSTDLPAIASRIDVDIVMANSHILFDNMADVNGRWLTRGYPSSPGHGGKGTTTIDQNMRGYIEWTMGEAARAVPWTQTSAKIGRVEIDPKDGPPDRFAMRFDYDGPAAAYVGHDRYFPGNAFKFGVWVKGDGSGNRLFANFLDYSDLSDFYTGGWKRTYEGQRLLCRLDFIDWRYVEVPLPGNGIGTTTLRGSTEGIDFPVELTGLLILPDAEPRKPDPNRPPSVTRGTVLIGPMFADTQQTRGTTLAAMIAYDAPQLEYGAKLGAHVSIQNAWREGSRKVEAMWTLADKDNQPIVTGKQELDIPAGAVRSFRIELADEAAKIAPRAGPLRLQVVASDKADLSTTVTREIVLAKPDCAVPLADFESDRGYFGTRVEGVKNAPPKGEAAAHTTTAQKHSGNRSLEIAWDNDENSTRFVAVDPPIPGVSVDVTLWVKGDGSGALFYPLIGGPNGVRAGLGTRTWNLFVPRAQTGDLQDAVRLDFTDWRQFTFRFTPPGPNFDKPLPVLPFLPSYPQGLHLAVDARDATGDGGKIYVDDVSVRTHLPPDNRLAFSLRRDGESNVIRPDAKLTFVAANYDAASPRKATIAGGVYDWRGNRVAALDQAIDLKPGEARDVVLDQNLPPGAYELRAQMKEGDRVVNAIVQDLIVADLAPILGPDWQIALKDKWKLRAPIRDDFTYLDEDWDWVEHQPGNLQTDSMRNRFTQVKENGAKPWMLLGFAALWSAGTSFEQMQAGAFDRGPRHVGQGVDIFQVPQRDADWEDYTLELMRGVGKDVSGWVLWDNPDGTSSIALPPKRLASFIRTSDKWRQVYCPKTPLIIGGMARATAIPYLQELAKEDALGHISGVNVRMDVGRMSPEDAQLLPYVKALRDTLAAGGPTANVIALTELDWAVEKTTDGLSVFDQAAYLSRADLLLSRAGVKPALNVVNEDAERLGTGLAYRSEIRVPPMTEKPLTWHLKPAWWAVLRTRELLSQLKTLDLIDVHDVMPLRTQAMLFERTRDGRAVVIAWRNDDPGATSFARTGLTVESAADLFGAPVSPKDGWYPIGKLPTVFTLSSPAANAREGLSRLWARDGEREPSWPQRVLAEFPPAADSFDVDVPKGSGLVIRKKYRLDKTGQTATVTVDGKPAGHWDLKRSEAALSEGTREAIFVIEPNLIAGPKAKIEIKAESPANALGITVFEYRPSDPFPLAAVGPLHADQQVGPIRLGRNMVGGPLKVDAETFANGIGAYANSLLEYPLNGQFKRFTAKAGVDAATEGKGSVVFEVWADGKKVWTSGVVSGLDRAKAIDLDVTGVNRLRLVVNDGNDGNKFDAGDWCEPVLAR